MSANDPQNAQNEVTLGDIGDIVKLGGRVVSTGAGFAGKYMPKAVGAAAQGARMVRGIIGSVQANMMNTALAYDVKNCDYVAAVNAIDDLVAKEMPSKAGELELESLAAKHYTGCLALSLQMAGEDLDYRLGGTAAQPGSRPDCNYLDYLHQAADFAYRGKLGKDSVLAVHDQALQLAAACAEHDRLDWAEGCMAFARQYLQRSYPQSLGL